MNAKDVIDPGWYKTYDEHRDRLFSQIVMLNTRLSILEMLEDFPFLLFLPLYDDRVFWDEMRNSLAETIIMGIWRIGIDTRNNALTLKRLKNEIRKHLCDQSAKEDFKNRCKGANFKTSLSVFEEKIKTIRHQYLAHHNQKPDNLVPINLKELREIHDILYDLLRVLFFETHPAKDVWANYSDSVKKTLDAVARDSHYLNWPEKAENAQFDHEKEWLDEWLEGLSQADFDIYNEYRRKFNLPEVSR
jgi:hypothetical protein